ncbi:MAG: MazG family protein [Microbacteriaceae bacterium]
MTDVAAHSPSEPTALDTLVAEFSRLRDPEHGCVWNKQQTHESLVRYLVEETYELVEAIETGDRDGMLEELGDVLYQLVFHADIASTTPGENFDIQDVAARATEKMIRRHPHVYGDASAPTVDEVIDVWTAAKAEEKTHRTSVLDGVPPGMPSLALADKLLGRAERAGLIDANAPAAVNVQNEDELGPLLLAIVASARANGLDAERALRTTLRELQREIREGEPATTPVAEPGETSVS